MNGDSPSCMRRYSQMGKTGFFGVLLFIKVARITVEAQGRNIEPRDSGGRRIPILRLRPLQVENLLDGLRLQRSDMEEGYKEGIRLRLPPWHRGGDEDGSDWGDSCDSIEFRN